MAHESYLSCSSLSTALHQPKGAPRRRAPHDRPADRPRSLGRRGARPRRRRRPRPDPAKAPVALQRRLTTATRVRRPMGAREP